ncbi:hypothetical protein F5B20DRAFT_578855 [Whalleya microplaca]|nr:hypothetical protein F5B20DRAFT_578855 [Whalleya microplaca]
MPRILLIDLLPKAGLRFLHKPSVHKQRERDRVVYNALKDKGIINDLSNATVKHTKIYLQETLVNTFTRAVIERLLRKARTGVTDEQGFYSFFAELQGRVQWAKDMPKAAFIEFIFRLAEARLEFKRNPYTSVKEPCDLAKAIDLFLEDVGDNWSKMTVGFKFFMQQDGQDKEDAEKEKEGDKDKPMVDVSSLGEALDEVAEGANDTAGTTPMDLD